MFSVTVNPVQAGLVTSLSRPGGNVTGTTYLSVEVGPKLLELMHEVVPAAKTFAVLVNPGNVLTETLLRDWRAAAGPLGLTLTVFNVSSDRELDAAFTALAEPKPGGLVMGGDAALNARMEQIAARALPLGLPTIYPSARFVAGGGLMSYGGSRRRCAPSGRRLYRAGFSRAQKPADLPVQQSTKVELVINLKTAKALGITVPPRCSRAPTR